MESKKNICVIINFLKMGGAEKQAVLLAKALNPYHNVIMVILNPKGIHQQRLATLEQEKIPYRFLSRNSIKNLFRLTKLFKEHQVDFIFSYLATDTVFSGICGNIAKVPFIFGGIRNSFIPRWKFTILRTVHNRWLDYTIANNYAGYLTAIDFGYLPKKLFVIPNGIEVRKLSKTIKDTSQIRIISLGRLVPQKRYDIAIRAIAHLKKTSDISKKLKYSIVGKGPEYDAVINLIQKYEVSSEVEVITDAQDIYALLEAADIYLCSSSFEGISNSLLEAMNCALPIVATDVGDNSCLVLDKKNGFLCPDNDFKAIANRLKELIENPTKRAQMGLESYEHLKENFSFEAFQKKYLTLIANVPEINIEDGDLINVSST